MEATSERVQVSGHKPASLYMDLSDAVARVQLAGPRVRVGR